MAFSVLERTTNIFTANIVDETGAGIAATSLASLTLTLYDAASLSIINARSSQNILNANGVVVTSSGGLTWTMAPADNPVVDDTLPLELHLALFTFAYGTSGSKVGRHQEGFSVVNLTFVP